MREIDEQRARRNGNGRGCSSVQQTRVSRGGGEGELALWEGSEQSRRRSGNRTVVPR